MWHEYKDESRHDKCLKCSKEIKQDLKIDQPLPRLYCEKKGKHFRCQTEGCKELTDHNPYMKEKGKDKCAKCLVSQEKQQ